MPERKALGAADNVRRSQRQCRVGGSDRYAGSTQGEVSGTGAITAHLLNVTANTGIDLTGANDIAVLGTDHTNSGPNVIDGVQ